MCLVQQATAYVDDPELQQEFARWGTVWHHSVFQFIQSEKKIDPPAAALLTDAELAMYHASKKPRQLVASKMRQLIRQAALPDAQVRAGWQAGRQPGRSALGGDVLCAAPRWCCCAASARHSSAPAPVHLPCILPLPIVTCILCHAVPCRAGPGHGVQHVPRLGKQRHLLPHPVGGCRLLPAACSASAL